MVQLEELRQENSRLRRQLFERESLVASLQGTVQTFNKTADDADWGSWEWDMPSGRYSVNAEWAAILGHTIEELEHLTIQTRKELCHPDDLEHSYSALEEYFKSETGSYEAEFRMRHKQGHWVWVLDRGMTSLCDRDGSPLRMSGTLQSISPCRHAEPSLAEDIREFTSEPVYLFRWNSKAKDEITYVSPNIKELLGYRADEMTGGNLRFDLIIHPDDKKRFLLEVKAFSEKCANAFKQEYRLVRKDGTSVRVHDYTMVFRDVNNQIIRFEGYVIETTARELSNETITITPAFDRMFTALSNSFIETGYAQTDEVIRNALQMVGKFIKADCCYLHQFYRDPKLVGRTWEWCAEGTKPKADAFCKLSTELFPWWMSRVKNCEIIQVSQAEELPDEACAEKELLESQNIESLIHVPLAVGLLPYDYVSFGALSRKSQWQKETVSILKLAGAIIANALQRNEEEKLIKAELDLAIMLSGASTFQETLRHCLNAALSISGMDCGGIYLVNKREQLLMLAYHEGLPDSFIEHASTYRFDTENARTVLAGQPIYGHFDMLPISNTHSASQEQLHAVAILPISFRGEVVACLNVASHSLEQIPDFSRKGLETITSQIGVSIMQARHESRLADKKKNLESLFDTIDDFLFIIDMQGKIIHTNAALNKWMDYPAEKLRGRQFSSIHPEEKQEEAKAILKKMIAGSVASSTVPMITGSGRLIPVETKVTKGLWNNMPVFFGISRDISERMKSQQALLESEKRFRELTERLPLPLFETDTNGNITYTNQKVSEEFGYSHDELLDSFPVLRFCIPFESESFQTSFQAVLDGKIVTNEYIVSRKNGTTFPAFLSCSPIISENLVTGSRGFFLNLTELKKAEETFRAHTAQLKMVNEFKTLLSNIPGAVYRFNDRGRATILSGMSTFLPGYDKKDIETGLFQTMALIHPDDRASFIMSNYELMQSKTLQVHTFRIMNSDGYYRWIEDRKTSTFSSDGIFTGIDGILYDISDRINSQDEKQQLESRLRKSQRLETIGTLAGGIAHDFNNILTPILGYSEMGIIGLNPQDQLHEYFTEIMNAAERAQNLVSQILTFSRAHESKPSVVRVQSIVKEALKLLRPSIPSTISIEQHIDHSCRNILADPSQIHQVIVNLCTNAFQAMEESGGTLTIELIEVVADEKILKPFPQPHAEVYVMLSVTDTGKGMTEDTIERIFEPFFTTKSVNKGTGLGLSVVHGIVRSYKGDIVVTSTPGKGTTLHVYLPVINESEHKESAREPFKAAMGGCALFIDDEPASVQMMQVMMTKLGFTIQSATSPLKALEMFRENPDLFDLAITDLTMPEMTGIEVAAELHKTRPHMPVILMTGYGKDIDYATSFTKYGISKLLKKPVKLMQLASSLNEIITAKNS